MGPRKGGGRSAFVKATLRPGGGASGAEEQEVEARASCDEGGCAPPVAPPAADPAAAPTPTPAPAPAPPPPATAASPSKAPATRGQLLQRHKLEARAAKEASKRAGKKGKAEAAAAEAALAARHAAELAAFDGAPGDGGGGGGSDSGSEGSLAGAVAGVRLEEEEGEGAAKAKAGGPTRAQARRAARAAAEAARDAAADADRAAAAAAGPRVAEAAALAATLAARRLAVVDVPADGHCLFAALAHQLSTCPSAPRPPATAWDVPTLRSLAASHMRAHRAEFEPFVAAAEAEGGDEAGGGGPTPGAPSPSGDAFEDHCAAVEHTAAWGGQAEVAALAAALPAAVTILAVGLPPVVMGEGNGAKNGTENADSAPPPALTICYLRHALALGEHYNSVAPLEEEEGGEEEEGEDGV